MVIEKNKGFSRKLFLDFLVLEYGYDFGGNFFFLLLIFIISVYGLINNFAYV